MLFLGLQKFFLNLWEIPHWNEGKVFIHEYHLCAECESLRDASAMAFSLWNILSNGGTTGNCNSIQVPTILEVLCMFLVWMSVTSDVVRSWNGNYYIKTFHLVVGVGGVFGKILIFFFFKEQRAVDESIWGYNDQSLHCLPSLPNRLPKWRK